MELSTPVFPFTAIVGQENMKQALVLSLINPDIGGVLIRGERGTGKSTAVRALASLLPPISVVAGCSFRCDPEEKALMCRDCLERFHQGESLAAVQEPMRVVDLPLGATEEMVLGTLNIEQAVRQGEKSFEPGLLAKSHRGFLYVDEVNLLPDHLVDILLDAAAMGVNVVEREGISYSHPSKFILVGTMNPDEGELRPQLQDRFALCAAVRGLKDEEARGQVVSRRLAFEDSPQTFAQQWHEKERDLARRIIEAKDRVARVELPERQIAFISRLAAVAGADGHRADIAIAKAAIAMAAYSGRNGVTRQEIKAAARLILPHRLRLDPAEDLTPPEKVEQVLEKVREVEETTPAEPAEKAEIKKKLKGPGSLLLDWGTRYDIGSTFKVRTSGRSPVKRQRLARGKRLRQASLASSGRYVKSRLPHGRPRNIAVDATLRAAVGRRPHDFFRYGCIRITTPDIREKMRVQSTGTAILFLLDASGSMGANRRMVLTKGIMLSLLNDAYYKRDQVALLAFRAAQTEILLPFTRSPQVVKEKLRSLAVGGKTPLGLGLKEAEILLRRQNLKNAQRKTLLVVVSDGKGNVALEYDDPYDEAMHYAQVLEKRGIESVFIDTEEDPCSFGYGRQVARAMGAHYLLAEDIVKRGVIELPL